MMYDTWLGMYVLSESPSKKFLGFLLEDSQTPDTLYLNFYSDEYGKYSSSTVYEVHFTDLVSLVAANNNNKTLLKNYFSKRLPACYSNRPHEFFISEALMLTILADVSLLDMSEQPCPDYEADPYSDPDSIYYPDEDVEFEGDADFMFDD